MIRVENLEKVYKEEKTMVWALRGVSLEIRNNEFVSIMGPSGSGKTTLMNIIGCLDRPTKGKVTLDELSIESLNDNQLAKVRNQKIGFVFQTFNLLPRSSALENVELPLIYAGVLKKERQKRAEELLLAVGLKDRMHHKSNELSGGEKQRVAIARALINNPSVILADEPTGNLDSKSGEEIMRIFGELNEKGTTIVVVTHNQQIANYSNRIVNIIDGKIVADEKREP